MCLERSLQVNENQGWGAGALVVGVSVKMSLEFLECLFGFMCRIQRQRFWKDLG